MKQQTSIEQDLIRIWQQVLERDDIGPRDDFYRLGGNSILIMQVVALARDEGIPLRVRDFFTLATVSELAEVARERVG